MSDSLCKFLDARCMTTGSQFFDTYFSAQKPFIFLPLVSLHNPTLVRRRGRGRRKLIHIAFCSTPTSPNLDVISTHEHSDGSLLFRFGDPSELAKEDELEEPLLGVEELERDSEEEFSVLKVLDGDNEREVIVKKVEREAGGQDESVAEVNIENAEHVEEICEKKDDSEASVPSPENAFPSLEVEEEMKGQSSDESFEELDDDKSPLLGSTAAMPEYSDSENTKEIEESEGEGSNQLTENDGNKDCHDDSTRLMENGATLSEIEAADNDIEIVQQTEKISENIDPIMEEPIESAPDGINLGNTETVVEEISPENADIKHLSVEIIQQTEQVSENVDLIMEEPIESAPEGINLGNTETVVDEISPENADIKHLSVEIVQQTEQVSENVDLIMEEPIESAPKGINLGNTETFVDEISPENADIKNLSMDAEYQSTEVLNFENEDQTELINLSVDTEDQASQDGTFKDSGETNVIEAMPLSPKLEAEPILDEEVDQNLISESNEGESPLPVSSIHLSTRFDVVNYVCAITVLCLFLPHVYGNLIVDQMKLPKQINLDCWLIILCMKCYLVDVVIVY